MSLERIHESFNPGRMNASGFIANGDECIGPVEYFFLRAKLNL